MGDWFDFNNDGKLDAFEEASKWNHINHSLEQLEKNSGGHKYSGGNSGFAEGCGTVLALIIAFALLYWIFC